MIPLLATVAERALAALLVLGILTLVLIFFGILIFLALSPLRRHR